jgi:hypothetical protein
MGSPSCKKRSARRPGKRERARVKNNRGGYYDNALGVDLAYVKAGRKHSQRYFSWFAKAHLAGNLSNSKADQKS